MNTIVMKLCCKFVGKARRQCTEVPLRAVRFKRFRTMLDSSFERFSMVLKHIHTIRFGKLWIIVLNIISLIIQFYYPCDINLIQLLGLWHI